MQSRSYSLSDHRAFHLALLACVCVVLVLLTGISPDRLAGTDSHIRQIDDHVEQIQAPNHTAVPMVDIGSAEDLLEEGVELAEPADDGETKHCFLPFGAVLPFDVPGLGSQAGLYESSADRALTPFQLRAFSTRGSPSA